MTRPRLNAWLLAPVTVVIALCATGYYRAQVPTRAEWAAAAEHVRGEMGEGDGVAWAPYWAGEGRLALHGLPVFHLPEVGAADLARYDRVWLLGAFGYGADALPPGHRVLGAYEFGAVQVELVEVGGERVVGDLYAQLESVVVSRRSGGAAENCDFWDGRGWHCRRRRSPAWTRECLAEAIETKLAKHRRRKDPRCGLDRWLNVSRDVRVIGDHPRRCVWFHPHGGKSLRMEWAAAPEGTALVIDYGFTDKVITDHTRAQTRTRPATLRAYRGDRLLGAHTAAPIKGWHRWRLDGPGAGPLRIEVESTSSVDAHLCIDPTIRVTR